MIYDLTSKILATLFLRALLINQLQIEINKIATYVFTHRFILRVFHSR